MLHTDVEHYLPGDLLVKMDIATMASSLEARSPFLDHKLMEFAARLPSQLKLRRSGARLTSKYLMKAAARGVLPDEVLDRPKMGFGVPIAAWLRGDLHELTRDALTDRVARQRGFFEPAAVQRLLDEHDSGVDHSPRIWGLLQFELWCRAYLDQRASSATDVTESLAFTNA
jgi:asparagine synthase (glutamine-hydrolysing)